LSRDADDQIDEKEADQGDKKEGRKANAQQNGNALLHRDSRVISSASWPTLSPTA